MMNIAGEYNQEMIGQVWKLEGTPNRIGKGNHLPA